jgi:hypothetical protein
MRFILVNGRTPCAQSSCVLCCRTIGASYLREIGTQLPYCDHNCYAEQCKRAASKAVEASPLRAKGARP